MSNNQQPFGICDHMFEPLLQQVYAIPPLSLQCDCWAPWVVTKYEFQKYITDTPLKLNMQISKHCWVRDQPCFYLKSALQKYTPEKKPRVLVVGMKSKVRALCSVRTRSGSCDNASSHMWRLMKQMTSFPDASPRKEPRLILLANVSGTSGRAGWFSNKNTLWKLGLGGEMEHHGKWLKYFKMKWSSGVWNEIIFKLFLQGLKGNYVIAYPGL